MVRWAPRLCSGLRVFHPGHTPRNRCLVTTKKTENKSKEERQEAYGHE